MCLVSHSLALVETHSVKSALQVRRRDLDN